jgi:hypothetical protein
MNAHTCECSGGHLRQAAGHADNSTLAKLVDLLELCERRLVRLEEVVMPPILPDLVEDVLFGERRVLDRAALPTHNTTARSLLPAY